MVKNNVVASEPLEAEEQKMLFKWAEIMEMQYPELRFMYHVPNGGRRRTKEAANLKAEGVKAGVPDVVIPAARGCFHGLYIEMKRQKSGSLSQDQKDYLDFLQKQGYCAVMCRGWKQAASTILMYLGSKKGETRNVHTSEKEADG